MQSAAHYAAKTNIKRNLRKAYSPPTAEEILEQASRPYQETGCGDLPFLLHIGPRRVFVSKNFVAFGASQQGIGNGLGICSRTVQRHQQAISLERRQIMQSRSDYGRVRFGINHEASFYSPDPTLHLIACGNDYILSEYHQARSAKSKPYNRVVTKESFSNYYDKWWVYRCNIYATPFRLCSMRAARKYFSRQLPQIEAKQEMSEAEIKAFNFAAADVKIEDFNLEKFLQGAGPQGAT